MVGRNGRVRGFLRGVMWCGGVPASRLAAVRECVMAAKPGLHVNRCRHTAAASACMQYIYPVHTARQTDRQHDMQSHGRTTSVRTTQGNSFRFISSPSISFHFVIVIMSYHTQKKVPSRSLASTSRIYIHQSINQSIHLSITLPPSLLLPSLPPALQRFPSHPHRNATRVRKEKKGGARHETRQKEATSALHITQNPHRSCDNKKPPSSSIPAPLRRARPR